MDFGIGDLIRSFGLSTIQRARSRVERGEVEIIPAGPDATRVFGTVRPAGESSLRVASRIRLGGGGGVELSGDCTCPTPGDCEHIAAVLLSALDPGVLHDEVRDEPAAATISERKSASRAVSSWLDRIVSTLEGGPSRDARAPDKHRLLYILGRRPHDRRVTVHPLLAYLRKDGRYGATKRCSYMGSASRPAWLTLEDRELLPAVLGNSSEYWTGTFYSPMTIDVEAGASLLERLIATGRCHWQDPSAPALRRGESRPGRIEWTLDQEGLQSPRLLVDGDAQVLALAVEPPWYVDTGQGTSGPIALGFGKETALALLEAPDLPPEEVERVRTRLATTFTAARLPLPDPVPADLHERSPQPVPHLLLHTWRPRFASQEWNPAEVPSIPAARLSFDYDGVRVPAGEPRVSVQRVVDGRLVRVRRDLEFEAQAASHLEEMGFERVFDEGHWMVRVDDEPATEFIPNYHVGDPVSFLIEFDRVEATALQKSGWTIEMADDYPVRLIEGEQQWYADIDEGANEWFELEMGVEIDGERHSLLPILVEMLRDPRLGLDTKDLATMAEREEVVLRVPDGRLLLLPGRRVRAILGTLTELFREGAVGDGGALSLTVWNSPSLAELDESLGRGELRWSGGERLRELGRKLRELDRMRKVETPDGFHGKLRPYQHEGLNWLQFLREHDLAGVLADDMGLGKTIQVLAHLLAEKRAGRMDRPCLIVAPTSVVSNWRREAERFAPDLSVLVLRGQSRKQQFDRMAEHDLVLTTYPLLSRDEQALAKQSYHALILDEAQFVKNAKTKTAGVARRIEARHRLCLTGTPMENHLGELWSLFHILMPGLLGDSKQFRRIFRTPIEKNGDLARSEQLAARVRPFLLRRTKDQVAADLPPKTEVTRTIELERSQRDLYESIRLAMHEKVRKEIRRKGLGRSTIVILDALLKLRQICCDPRLLKLAEARRVTRSAKLVALMQMLDEMLAEGRRILLFSQFTSMIALIEQELSQREIPWVRITGDTRDRDTPVRRFQKGEVPLFLISLKAGGTGLNLTAADTVLHYDPWWNPAVEDQATDRAHRIGQDKPVFSYRLIVAGSVEEKILALQARKRDLADGVYGDRASKSGPPLSPEDLEVLFRPLE